MTKQSDKVSAMMESKVNLNKLGTPGECPTLHEKLVLDLAKAYQEKEDPENWCVSWANQQKAQDYFNEHGFEATLDQLFSL